MREVGMSEVDFDAHADRYDITLDETLAIGGGDGRYYAERKFSTLAAFCHGREHATPSEVLDFGCGTGTNLPFLRQLFPHAFLHGVDVSARSIEIAETRKIPDCRLLAYDGQSLPYRDGQFDMVVASNVLHHISPGDRFATILEISRCIKAGGLFAIFEHNPRNPLTRRIVRECPFDVGVTLVRARDVVDHVRQSGFEVIALWNIIFVPASIRRLNMVEPYLRWLPLGAQYSVFARRCM